jgi:hypothetical protein
MADELLELVQRQTALIDEQNRTIVRQQKMIDSLIHQNYQLMEQEKLARALVLHWEKQHSVWIKPSGGEISDGKFCSTLV